MSAYNRDEARERLREHLTDYLTELGVKWQRGAHFRCLNPEHDDKHPSMAYDAKHNRVHCFSCGVSYDIIDLWKINNGGTDTEAFAALYDKYGIQVQGAGDNSNYPPEGHGAKTASDPVVPQNAGTLDKQQEAPAVDEAAIKEAEKWLAECAERAANTHYWTETRGLSPQIIQRFRLGFDPAFSTYNNDTDEKGQGGYIPVNWRGAVIPLDNRGAYIVRNTDGNADKQNRVRKRKGAPASLFNAAALRAQSPVFIVEGEIDALSVLDVGGAAVGLGGISNINLLISHITNNRIKPAYPLQIALDADEAGSKAAEKLAEELKKAGVKSTIISLTAAFGTNDEGRPLAKDANEALLLDRDLFAAEVRRLADAEVSRAFADIDAASASAFLPEFDDIVRQRHDDPATPTGFQGIDEKLLGGLTAGFYVVGAISSLGKTAFALQMADYIAARGRPVIIFSLEMPREELVARSISRETYRLCKSEDEVMRLARSTRSVLTGLVFKKFYKTFCDFTPNEREHLDAARAAYEKYAHNLYIVEWPRRTWGSVNCITEFVRRFVAYKRVRPVVVVDYLQILPADDPRQTDKQRTDAAVIALKQDLSRELLIPVIAVSSFNRDNYSQPVSLQALKESGGIEYTADVVIGLQLEGTGAKDFDVNAAKARNPRRVEAVILKNRNGPSGDTIPLLFDARFNMFCDSEEYAAQNPETVEGINQLLRNEKLKNDIQALEKEIKQHRKTMNEALKKNQFDIANKEEERIQAIEAQIAAKRAAMEESTPERAAVQASAVPEDVQISLGTDIGSDMPWAGASADIDISDFD